MGNWGFYGQLGEGFQGYISFRHFQQKCFIDPPGWFWAEQDTNYEYHDQFGVTHSLNYSYNACTDGNPNNGDGSTSDGSGIWYDQTYIHLRSGTKILPPTGPSGGGTITDTNGNYVTNNGNGTFVDTTGVTELTIGGGGNASSPLTFTYPALVSGTSTTATATVYYQSYTVQTNFGCAGISEYSASSVSLVDHITLADSPSDTYTFTYEPTPGVSGAVTGRLASVTLPSGGTISYTYGGGCSGGINTDGTPATLLRATSDGQKTYTRNISGAPASTTYVSDEKGNETDFNFVSDTNGNTFETSRTAYQGVAPGTPILARNTCYNQAPSPCNTSTFTSPISQIDTYETLNGSQTHGSTAIYNTYGMQTEADVYDFGSGSRGALLRRENWTYGAGIASLVTEDDVFDGIGTLSGKTLYTYDQGTPVASSGVPQHVAGGNAGNLTALTQFANSGTSYTSTATYEDTGSLLTSTTPNGTTTYSYDSTFAYNTGVSLPTPSSGVALSMSAAFDTTSTGLPLSSTDPNAQLTRTPSYDLLLRSTEVDYPDGGKTTGSYSPTTATINTLQTSSVSDTSEVQLDGYGRTSRTETANGQSGNSFYQQDTCYDASGYVAFSSYRYQGTGFGSSKVCSGNGDSSTYDALGRVTQITRGNSETLHYTYSGRATQSVDENGVTRITQVDGLGRPVIVCEISSNPNMPGSGSPVSCGTDIAGTGFVTTYSYTLATPTTTISQGGQTRIFQTDWLGRTTSVTEPESGTTTYSYGYNSTGLVVTRNRPKANQTNPSVLTTTTSQFDSLGRLVSINYSDGTPARQYLYDANGGFAAPQSNLKGRLSRATASTSPNFTGTVFSYDAVGRIIGLSECFPWTCGTPGDDKNLLYTYDLAGDLASSTDGNNVTTNYSYSPASEVQGITSSLSDPNHPGTLLSNVQNGPFGPLNYTLGNGISQVNSYDGLGRPNASSVCPSAPGSIGCGGQIYGFTTTWKGTQLQSSTDTVAGNFTYTYDEFNRLTGTANANGPFYTYTYDRWGNRTAQTPWQGGFTFQQAFNAANQVNRTGFTYDAAGNLTSDGTNSYVYDAEGNVIQGAQPFIYDALNHQVGQVFNSSIKGSAVAFDKDGNFASLWIVNNDNSLSVIGGKAYWNGAALDYYNSSSAFFEHRDWVGTRRATTNSAATVTNVRTSLPFGDGAANVSGGQDNTFDGYTGMWNGGATDHTQFREYWNVAGRWVQPDPYSGSYDPSNPQSFNRYAYALNNPVRFVDPLGLTDEDDTDDDDCDDDSVVCAAPGNNGGGSGGGGPKDPNNPGNCAPYDPNCVSVGGGVPPFDPDFVMMIISTPITAVISPIPNDPCYNSALASVGVGPAQLRQRIKTANNQSLVGAGLGMLIGNPNVGALIAYARLVHTGGPQDDKNLSQNHSVFGPPPNAVAAGNISFGVTCPFGAAACQFAAGLAQTLSGHPDPKGTLATGFDTPSDNAQIKQGQAMRAAGCHT